MSNKRLSRGRLFGIEKEGKDVDVSTEVGISKAVVSATQHREGHKVVTDILVDLGTSKANIQSGGITAGDPIGVDGQKVALCKVTDAVFGVVSELEVVCLEAASDGTLADFMIMSSSVGTATFGDTGTDNEAITGSANLNQTTASLNTVGLHQHLTFNNSALTNKFIYVGTGVSTATAANSGSCTITVNTDSTGSIVNDATTIALRTNDAASGKILYLSASTGTAYNDSAVANQFHVKDADTAAKIAEGIKNGIDNLSEFDASVSDNVVTISHATLTLNGNQTNPGWNDAGGQSTDVTVSNFGGAHPNSMNSGKFLLRFTGFMTPDDV